MKGDERQYRVLDVLGRGGFGTVYLARMESEGFQKLVAIKLIQDDVVNVDVLQRFRDEARILGLLRHRAIVQVDPPVLLNGRWAVVMEFVDGASLARVQKRSGPVPPRAALQIVAEVARALDKAVHQPGPDRNPLGLIHRDLKPANIQITSAGEVKILDFGNARATFAQRESHTTSGLIGTPGYIAPERFDGIEDPRGDVFSLGGVLHRLLVGDLPGYQETVDIPSDKLVNDAIELASRMREPEFEKRMTARDVERAINDLLENATGPRLRAWAEENVPERSRTQPDDLVGTTLRTSPGGDVPTGPATRTANLRQPDTLGADGEVTGESTGPITQTTSLGRRAAWVMVVGVIAVLALTCGVGAGVLGALGVTWPGPTVVAVPDPTPPPIPEPEPKPAPVAPDPEPEVEPETEPEAPAPEPEPASPAPAPRPAPVAAPAPEPAPAPAPEPVAAPEPAPAVEEPDVKVVDDAPDAAPVRVAISSVPFGLPVTVDGKAVGKTPSRVELPPGKHEVDVGGTSRTIEVGPRLPTRYVLRQQDGEWDSFL